MTDADLIIVDGMNVMWRAAHAMGALGFEDRNGFIETGAVYGFFEQVLAVVNRNKFADVLIAWEGSRAGRRAIVEDYKAHRDEPDEKTREMLESIDNQRSILRGILKSTSWGQIVAPGWEADDAMATAALAGYRAGLNVLILSNDTDLFQCLRDGDDGAVYQWKSGKSTNNPVWTPERLVEEHGVTPAKWSGVKALGGDASDGYKGVHGIGEKWACKFMAAHETLNDVVEAALAVASGEAKSDVITKKKAEAITEQIEYLAACYELAKVRDQLRTITQWGEPDTQRLVDVLRGLRFHSLCSNKTIRRLT